MEKQKEQVYWAGCNYYINKGELAGTATSMHDCSVCDNNPNCPDKKETETWVLPREEQ